MEVDLIMKAIGKGSLSSVLAALINGAWYLVAIALAFMLCMAVLPFVTTLENTQMSIPVSFSVATGALRVTSRAPEATKTEIREAEGRLVFPPPSGVFLTTTALLVALALAIALWVLAQLRAVFRTLRDGHPFVPANAARIRWIGYVIMLAEIVRSAVLFSGNVYARSHFAADGLRFDAWPSVDVFALIHGLIIVVLAEVFRAGTRLDEDQSLTI